MNDPDLKPKESSPGIRRGLASRSRRVACVATLTAAGLSLGLVACGNSGSDSAAPASTQAAVSTPEGSGQMSDSTPPQGMPGGPPQLTSKQKKCLSGQGLDLPDRPGTSGGTPPDRSSMPDPQEMKSAFEACGIDAPEPPSGQSGGMTQPPSGGSYDQSSSVPAMQTGQS